MTSPQSARLQSDEQGVLNAGSALKQMVRQQESLIPEGAREQWLHAGGRYDAADRWSRPRSADQTHSEQHHLQRHSLSSFLRSGFRRTRQVFRLSKAPPKPPRRQQSDSECSVWTLLHVINTHTHTHTCTVLVPPVGGDGELGFSGSHTNTIHRLKSE